MPSTLPPSLPSSLHAPRASVPATNQRGPDTTRHVWARAVLSDGLSTNQLTSADAGWPYTHMRTYRGWRLVKWKWLVGLCRQRLDTVAWLMGSDEPAGRGQRVVRARFAGLLDPCSGSAIRWPAGCICETSPSPSLSLILSCQNPERNGRWRTRGLDSRLH
jgi:hypothetical protein